MLDENIYRLEWSIYRSVDTCTAIRGSTVLEEYLQVHIKLSKWLKTNMYRYISSYFEKQNIRVYSRVYFLKESNRDIWIWTLDMSNLCVNIFSHQETWRPMTSMGYHTSRVRMSSSDVPVEWFTPSTVELLGYKPGNQQIQARRDLERCQKTKGCQEIELPRIGYLG